MRGPSIRPYVVCSSNTRMTSCLADDGATTADGGVAEHVAC
jgi:hypothetical protein